MQLEKLTTENFEILYERYIQDFCYEERRDKQHFLELLNEKKFNANLIKENGQYIGYICYWILQDFIFIEHYAIFEELRNKGKGTEFLKKFINETNKMIVLEVELPNSDIAKRRIDMYKNLGFVINDYKYLQPSYHNNKTQVPMCIMSLNKKLENKQFKNIVTLIKQEVYDYKFKRNQIVKKKRKLWYKVLKTIMKLRYKRPAFVYLGEKFENGCLIISNHEGTDAPMSLEIYNNSPTRMWGAHEMNSGLIKLYKYQTRVYYHEKKHWNLTLARLFCLLASPLTNIFYKGLNLISTYKDARFKTTINKSIEAIKKGENIVIYPEDSTNGYLQELQDFKQGFIVFCETCLKKGIDLPIYVSYFKKLEKVYIIDKPIKYSLLKQEHKKEYVADVLRKRCNELGKMNFSKEFIKKTKKQNKKDK